MVASICTLHPRPQLQRWCLDCMAPILSGVKTQEKIQTSRRCYLIVSTHRSILDHPNKFVPSSSLTRYRPAIKTGYRFVVLFFKFAS